MADVDLYKQAYRDYLGREASDDEANNWATGVYGGGSVQDRINQIANSGEAQARKAPTLGQQPQTSHGYEQPGGGAPAESPYYGTPESGYGPGGVQNPAYTGPGSSDRNSFDTQVGNAYTQYLGRSASPDEINNWWSGNYGYGSGASGLNSILGAIKGSGEAQAYSASRPPTAGTAPQTGGAPQGDLDGWVRSMLSGASSPQSLAALESQLSQRGIRLQKDSDGVIRGRLYMPDGRTVDVVNQWGQPWAWIDRGKGAGGVGGGALPGNQYSDAYTQLLEQLIKSRIGNLQGGYDDAMRQQYMSALQGRANALGQGNKQLDQLLGYLQERFTDLKGPGYTGAENEVIRTAALDPNENDRQAARKRVTEQLAARGFTPDSGVFQQAIQEVDRAFDEIRGMTQTTLASNELGRRENRAQRAEMIGSQIADIPEQRAREQLDVFSALEQLSMLARNEDEARSREAISYGGVLSDLGPQRLNMAMQAAGMGGNPASLASMLMGIGGMNQNAAAMNAQNSNALWSGLGALSAIMARSGQSGLSGVRG